MKLATIFCLLGYPVMAWVIFLVMYPAGVAPPLVVGVAMLGAALIAFRCARLDVEGK